MGCAKGTIKLLLHIFNLVIVVAALALLILGIISIVNLDEVTNAEDTVPIANIFIVVVAAIIFVIAFLGCCGAVKENKCFLMLYGIILIVLLLIQIAVGIYAVLELDEDDLKTELTKTVQTAFDKYGSNSASTEYLDTLQQNLECCGVASKADWLVAIRPIPDSCCPDKTCIGLGTNAYNKGCASQLVDYMIEQSDVIGYVALGLCLVEFIPAVFAFMLRKML